MQTERDYIDANRDAIDALIREAIPTIQIAAAHELAARNQAIVCLFFDLDAQRSTWLAERERMDAERDYRRGYEHGYSQAMDDLRATCRPAAWMACAQFFDDVLTAWRYARPKFLEPPPKFDLAVKRSGALIPKSAA